MVLVLVELVLALGEALLGTFDGFGTCSGFLLLAPGEALLGGLLLLLVLTLAKHSP